MNTSLFQGLAILKKSKILKTVSVLLLFMLITAGLTAPAKATVTSIPIDIELGTFNSSIVGGDSRTTLLWSRGNASTDSGVLRVVPKTGNQKGVVVRRNKIKLTGGFSTYFVMNMNSGSTPPADGLAFVIQNNPEPLVGNYGAGLGFQNVPNSLGVEFDIWENTGLDSSTNKTYSDPNANHVAIVKNGDNTHAAANHDVIDRYPGNLYGGGDISVWIDYDGTTLKATYGTSTTKSSSSNRSIDKNVGTFLNNQDVYVGFSGSTGSAWANIDIKKWYFSDTYVSTGLDPNPGTYTQGANSVGITLIPGSTNPTSANFRVKDNLNRDIVNQVVAIYLDDSTTSTTINTGTDGTKATYSIGKLSEGSHTLKGVAANGGASNSVTFNVVSPQISPTTATFDKNTSNTTNYVDKTVNMTLYEATLSSVKNGNTTLIRGSDYTVSGSVVTIKKEYLAAQNIGLTSLAFTFSDGSFKGLTVTVLDSTPPTGLVATAITQTSATLTWTATAGATSYKVFKDGTLVASPTNNTASITGLTAATLYSFTVSAVNTGGESAQSAALAVTTLSNAPPSTLKVLEVQPGTTYDLTPSLLSGTFPNSTIVITPMSMAEFISKVDEINGQYDIVYIGNNTSGGSYTALGTAPTNTPQGSNGSSSKEYYSDNDITNRRANTLKDFINSKQLTIFDQSIFGSSLANTKLYNNFSSIKNNTTVYPNFITVDTSSAKANHIKVAFSFYNTNSVAKRPELKINEASDQPMNYDGTDNSYQTVKSLGFKFDINNRTQAYNMNVKLYIDINGDGIYKATDDYAGKPEIVDEIHNISSNTGYTLNYHLPDSFVGLQPWKLELTDTSTGAKSFITGATAFKAINSGDEVIIRVLQLVPSGNTFSIYDDLKNVNGQNLLYKDKVYRIQVTEMTISNFNAAYTSTTPPNKSAKLNGVTGTYPTVLNGNYDMVIMGFADVYGNGDLTNTNAINALKSFIDTNQSVMLTHDTLTFDVNSPNTWGYNITQNFRDVIGQQRYYDTAPDSNRYYDPMPYSSKDSYGFTNLTLGRYNNGVTNNGRTFETTTKTHKINDNLVTQFPFPLGDITVSGTHFQYFQLDLEDPNVIPVYTLTNSGSNIYNHPGDGRNDYYTYTKGNITFSGTGHSTVNSLEEEKMFVNTMIKASRGANHAPTLDVYGISDGMKIANSLTSIDFSFKATDIDLSDQYLNADIYFSIDNGATYQNVESFSVTDSDVSNRLKSGVTQSVSIPTPTNRTNINVYKVKVVAADNSNAQTSKEITLNNVQDPQIAVQTFSASCLVGDTITVPVNVTATATDLKETFKDIRLQGILTESGKSEPKTTAYSTTYPDLIFNPNSSWTDNHQESDFSHTFNTVGNYTILNKLTYSAYDGASNPLGSRENEQPFIIRVDSGRFEVEVLDQQNRGISGITVNVSGHGTAITESSGLVSFSDLSTGEYTVTVTTPEGRSIANPSQTESLSADEPYKKVTFNMEGNLIRSSSLKALDGTSQMTTIKDAPFQTNIGVKLTRPVSSLDFMLDNDLSGSTANLAISKVTCDNQEIIFTSDSTKPGKISPSQSTSFPGGTYTIQATVTMTAGTMQPGQSFTIRLNSRTSAMDANTGTEETIGSSSPPLTVNVISMLTNPTLTTRSGSMQMDTLVNAPLQTNVGFTLTGAATFLTVDLTNSLGGTTNPDVTKVLCKNNLGQVQTVDFTADSSNLGKLSPKGATTFLSGEYTIYTTVTIDGAEMREGQNFTIALTRQTSAQDASSGSKFSIVTIPPPVIVYVLGAPKYH